MTARPLERVVQRLRRATAAETACDADLLRAFVRSGARDQRAFEALVRRHGPMVLDVARRILGNFHDAEDVFQAAFLVLARRAASVRPPRLVGNWLYGVALRTALEARRAILRRRQKERAAVPRAEPQPPDATESAAVLDEELACLPEKLRVALVLCELQGRTRRDVARELGIAEGTVASRVARGRVLLARRLARRGLGPAATTLAAALPGAATAGVQASLVRAAVNLMAGEVVPSATVTALVEGVLRAMFLNKLKKALGVLLFVALAAYGFGLVPSTPSVSGQTDSPKAASGKPTTEPGKNTLKIQVHLQVVDGERRTISGVDVTGKPSAEPKELGIDVQDTKSVEERLLLTRKRVSLLLGRLTVQPGLVNLPVAKDARITGDGKEWTVGDLRAGMRAEIELAVGPRGLQIVSITTDAKVEETVPPQPDAKGVEEFFPPQAK
jgi:RNA polymerase sigma factor (sigma-70 family)